jgi:hypothetical protein
MEEVWKNCRLKLVTPCLPYDYFMTTSHDPCIVQGMPGAVYKGFWYKRYGRGRASRCLHQVSATIVVSRPIRDPYVMKMCPMTLCTSQGKSWSSARDSIVEEVWKRYGRGMEEVWKRCGRGMKRVLRHVGTTRHNDFDIPWDIPWDTQSWE